MCLVFVALGVVPGHPLVLAGNRDEAHSRPTAPLAEWPDAPGVVAGRDLSAGGTWLGATRAGRWATVTNIRDPAAVRPDSRSRGALVAGFLRGTDTPEAYARRAHAERGAYTGFNLLVGHGPGPGSPGEAWLASTRRRGPERLAPGLHGLSNDTLDTPWPKLTRGRGAFEAALGAALARPGPLDPAALLAFLTDEMPAADADLPETGVGLDLERLLSPAFIRGDRYGTRATTALVLDAGGGGRLSEQTWGPDGARGALVHLGFGVQRGTGSGRGADDA